MTTSDWFFIDSQDDLNRLNKAHVWGFDGAETVEIFGSGKNESYFPVDVSRGGVWFLNVHLLVRLFDRHRSDEPAFYHLVLIGCEEIDSGFLQAPHFEGRVDSLKRVRLVPGSTMRCARLIYRPIDDGDGRLESFIQHGGIYLTSGASILPTLSCDRDSP
ncbi:MAG: hypothetical protein AB7W16_02885 [Candidatus Obscuribacterales bacterium]